MRTDLWLGGGVMVLALLAPGAAGGQDAPRSPMDLKATIVGIADRWVAGWLDKDWNEGKGLFKFTQGPYSDAFEHHYVAAVLLNTPESKFHDNGMLRKRVVADLLHYAGVFVEQCRDKHLRGYWVLNGAADKGIGVGSGSWQSRQYIRACELLDGGMSAEQRKAWREGARWLMTSLTVDWTETFGPWWSTNKVSDHVAGVAQWVHVSQDPKAKEFLDRQFDWYWRAYPEGGLADKYHNYFAKTLYRLAPVLLVGEAKRYHQPLLDRIRMWRSFTTPNGFYDAALHAEPNGDEAWHGKLGPVLSLLLAATASDPELALVAQSIAEQRLANWQSEEFWQRQFDPYFSAHWGSLGLILETAGQWQPALAAARKSQGSFERMRFFDYWPGLGRVAVKTGRYQASCYTHWAWTWDFALLGGTLYRLSTPGEFHFADRLPLGGGRFAATERTETARAWLDWDPHRDPETGGPKTGLVVARAGASVLSQPPDFPDEAIVTGLPEGRLYGLTCCRYALGDALEVRTTNVFLDDAVVVLNTVTALKDATFDSLYVQQSLANPGELVVRMAGGQTIAPAAENVRPAPSVPHAVSGPLELASRGGTGSLALVPLANSFTKQELVDISLHSKPQGDQKRVPHRTDQWRGYLPAAVEKGQVFLADFAYLPRDGKAAGALPAFQSVRTDRAHGVVVPGEPGVVIAQLIGDNAAAGEFAVGEFQCIGRLFAAELTGGKVRKACLVGQSLSLKGKPVVQLSRPAAVTVLPARGEGIADAGVGPLTVAMGGKAFGLFSTDHEYPRMACISQKIGAGPASGPRAGEQIADAPAACRRFASLPRRIDLAARLVEAEMLRQGASARLEQPDKEPDTLKQAHRALQADDAAKASPLIAEAEKQALALHAQADRAGKFVLAAVTRDAASELLPPAVAGQERSPMHYLISFAEERARDAVKRRAELLCRGAAGRTDGGKLCADVRGAEAALLGRYFALPICWTREHIPGQPDFFWRPTMLDAAEEPDGAKVPLMAEPLSAREKTLAKYIIGGDRIWLALRRIHAAEALVREAAMP